MQLTFPHGIYYPDNHDIPLSDIAATLVAHDKLLPVIADAFEILVPGLTVSDRKIILEKIERSSLNEAFFVALFVTFQKELEQEVPEFIETVTRLSVSDRYDTIVTVLFLVGMYYGAKAIFNRGSKSKAGTPTPVSINGDYNTYVNIAADQLNTSPDAVKDAFERAVGKKRLGVVQRAAVDLFRPAKRGSNGRIVPRNLPVISADTVADFPSEIALAEIDDDIVPIALLDARLSIRATDRDKTDKGWAGKAEAGDLKTRRLPIVLAPGIDPNKLAALDHVRFDGFIESRLNDDGGTKPLRIHVTNIL